MCTYNAYRSIAPKEVFLSHGPSPLSGIDENLDIVFMRSYNRALELYLFYKHQRASASYQAKHKKIGIGFSKFLSEIGEKVTHRSF